jgi:hypothetical protein
MTLGNRAAAMTALVTHHFGLDGTADALLLGRNVPNSIKAVIHPGQAGAAL